MKKTLSILVLLFLQIGLFAQINFSVEPQADGKTYVVKLKPQQSYDPRMSITNTAQVSFVVPTGGFEVGEILNFKGTWENSNNVVAPANNPKKDYIVFNLVGHISDLTYEEGQEVALFSFENTGKKMEGLRFVGKNDVKIIKANQINIGNQISVLGAGFKNAYSGTYVSDANLKADEEEEEEYEEGPEAEETHILYGEELPGTFEVDLSVVKEGISLEWLAQNKGKIKEYVLEKSMDGINFEPIQTIEPTVADDIKAIDDAPDYGRNYYRVKQQLTTGDFQYSEVKSEEFVVDKSSITVYPNPVKDVFNLKIGHFADLEGEVHIFNMSGVEMASKQIKKGDKRLSINTTNFQNGMYFLIIDAKGMKMVERQFIVENMK
ncbi:MAG: T9SS type A sorting domain-containing protein [Bacteroidota bacterium]